MYMIEITEDKMCDLYEHIEKGLKYMGKAMQCVEELKSEHMGQRMGRHDPKEWEDEGYEYGERMGQRMGQRGRYSRY